MAGSASNAEEVPLESAPAAVERQNELKLARMLKKCLWRVLQRHLVVRNSLILYKKGHPALGAADRFESLE